MGYPVKINIVPSSVIEPESYKEEMYMRLESNLLYTVDALQTFYHCVTCTTSDTCVSIIF